MSGLFSAFLDKRCGIPPDVCPDERSCPSMSATSCCPGAITSLITPENVVPAIPPWVIPVPDHHRPVALTPCRFCSRADAILPEQRRRVVLDNTCRICGTGEAVPWPSRYLELYLYTSVVSAKADHTQSALLARPWAGSSILGQAFGIPPDACPDERSCPSVSATSCYPGAITSLIAPENVVPAIPPWVIPVPDHHRPVVLTPSRFCGRAGAILPEQRRRVVLDNTCRI